MAGQSDSKNVRRPGLGVALAAVLFLALLGGMRYQWWQYPLPLDVLLDVGTVLLGILGLGVVGVFWAVRSFNFRRRTGQLPWQTLVAPLVVAAAAVTFAVVDAPAERDFDRANGEMEDFAVSMLRDGRDRGGPSTIADVYFSTVYVGRDECVYFVDSARSNSISRAGWLFTAQCTPDPKTFAQLSPLTENWNSYEQVS